MTDTEGTGSPAAAIGAAAGRVGRAAVGALTTALGGAERTRVIVLLGSVLALSSADASTVGAASNRKEPSSPSALKLIKFRPTSRDSPLKTSWKTVSGFSSFDS